jgi:hypothetical protein
MAHQCVAPSDCHHALDSRFPYMLSSLRDVNNADTALRFNQVSPQDDLNDLLNGADDFFANLVGAPPHVYPDDGGGGSAGGSAVSGGGREAAPDGIGFQPQGTQDEPILLD